MEHCVSIDNRKGNAASSQKFHKFFVLFLVEGRVLGVGFDD